MHLNGEKCLNVICREKLAGNGQMDLRLMILKKLGPQGSVCPHPVANGNIHVYYSDIQRASSLKLLGQSQPNFMRSIVRKWD